MWFAVKYQGTNIILSCKEKNQTLYIGRYLILWQYHAQYLKPVPMSLLIDSKPYDAPIVIVINGWVRCTKIRFV